MAIAREKVTPGSIVYAGEALGWEELHACYEMRRISHLVAFSLSGSCATQAESNPLCLRRTELGHHHQVDGKHLAVHAV